MIFLSTKEYSCSTKRMTILSVSHILECTGTKMLPTTGSFELKRLLNEKWEYIQHRKWIVFNWQNNDVVACNKVTIQTKDGEILDSNSDSEKFQVMSMKNISRFYDKRMHID